VKTTDGELISVIVILRSIIIVRDMENVYGNVNLCLKERKKKYAMVLY